MEKKFSIPLYAGLAAFFTATVIFNQNISLHPPTDQFLMPPPENIERFHLGFNESMADSFWLRWIQDSDNCQTYLKPVERLPDVDVSKQDPRKFVDPRHKICDGSWSFTMLDAVTKLAPRFRMPYLAGGISLAVLTEDYEGASKLFLRGVAVYPDDWNLAYRASYHFLFDVHDKALAARLLNQAAEHGAPFWLRSLAARAYSEAGELELGIKALEDYKKSLQGPKGLDEINRRIDDMKRRLAAAPRSPRDAK